MNYLIYIPSSVSEIKRFAFKYCSKIYSIIIPPNITSLAYCVFQNCDKLSLVIYLGESILDSFSVFIYCPKLKDVHVLPTYGSDSFCGKNVTRCIKTSSCGTSTKSIFDSCIYTLFISGQGAMFDYTTDLAPWFLYKNSIKSVIIEGEVTSVGNNCFSECTGLTSVIISSYVESIGDSTFYNCLNLEDITFEKESNLTIIGESSFSNCYSLEAIELPPQLKEISSHLFEGCNKLKSITILSNISKIQEYAFLKCSNLECILYYGTNNPEIFDNSFSGCEKFSFIITYLTYSNETFGSFKVQKITELPLACPSKNEQTKNGAKLKSGEIASIVICSFIFIVIICVVLFFTVFRKMKNKTPEEDTP